MKNLITIIVAILAISGFMRAGEDPNDKNEANKKARNDAWVRWKALLKKL